MWATRFTAVKALAELLLSCLTDTEADAITRVIGPDIAPAKIDEKGNILDEGSTVAWGTARGAAEGWIPFHGVVREFSGAARHDRLVRQAILSGFVRRAYLRGLMEAYYCN